MRRRIAVIALAGAALLAGMPAQAKLYKWVDAEGNVTYSERKPPDVDASELRLHGVGAPDEQTRERLDALTEESAEARKDRDFEESHATAQRQREEQFAKNCDTARQNVRILETSGRIKDPRDGNRFLSTDEVAQRLQQANDNVEKYCR